jgi:Na+-translocating ferredoxin:NAD+ oxidoreductase RnfD subunit
MIPSATANASNVKPAASANAAPQSLFARFISPQNRYLPPLFITMILLVSQVSFGVLESFSRTLLAIGTAIVFELVLSKLVYKKMPVLASAYITGISVGILCRTPEYWPFALTSAIAITSKYVIRWRGQHLWNPSNFSIAVMLLIVPEYFSTLGIQWGNAVWPMLVVWVLGAAITYRVKRFHITATYVLSFIALSFVRSLVTGHPFFAELAPITGPMYQLFIFFMITDPKTTVKSKQGQILVAFLVAVMEMAFRLLQGVTPESMAILSIDAPYYALTVVGPAAMAIDIWRNGKKKQGPPKVSQSGGNALSASAAV